LSTKNRVAAILGSLTRFDTFFDQEGHEFWFLIPALGRVFKHRLTFLFIRISILCNFLNSNSAYSNSNIRNAFSLPLTAIVSISRTGKFSSSVSLTVSETIIFVLYTLFND
jgi:hypothetical protein